MVVGNKGGQGANREEEEEDEVTGHIAGEHVSQLPKCTYLLPENHPCHYAVSLA